MCLKSPFIRSLADLRRLEEEEAQKREEADSCRRPTKFDQALDTLSLTPERWSLVIDPVTGGFRPEVAKALRDVGRLGNVGQSQQANHDDIVQVALLRAVAEFDPSHGKTFVQFFCGRVASGIMADRKNNSKSKNVSITTRVSGDERCTLADSLPDTKAIQPDIAAAERDKSPAVVRREKEEAEVLQDFESFKAASPHLKGGRTVRAYLQREAKRAGVQVVGDNDELGTRLSHAWGHTYYVEETLMSRAGFDSPQKPVLTPKEVQSRLQCGLSKVYKLLYSGDLEGVRLAKWGGVRIYEESVARLQTACCG